MRGTDWSGRSAVISSASQNLRSSQYLGTLHHFRVIVATLLRESFMSVMFRVRAAFGIVE
jgi:hypothetical protein